MGVCGCVIPSPDCHCNSNITPTKYFWHTQGTDYTNWNVVKESRTMRVLDKTVQINEHNKPVLLITLELPLQIDKGFQMIGSDFMAAFYDAIKAYEDQQTAKTTGGE
jgi:hypothetical protein